MERLVYDTCGHRSSGDGPHRPHWTLHDGAPPAPVVLHVPHSSRHVPASVREHLLLSDSELAIELEYMTDSGTAELVAAVAEGAAVRPWRFVNGVSRLVVDPERFTDEREEMRSVGMGAVYSRTSHGQALRADDPTHEAELLDTWFAPYAAALAECVDARLAATGTAVLVDVHSFAARPLPYELHAGDRRPEVCLGTDSRHTPPWLLALARGAFAQFDVAVDEPFRGTYVPLRHYGTDPRVVSVMLEIRRDVPPDSGAVVDALTSLVEGAARRAQGVEG